MAHLVYPSMKKIGTHCVEHLDRMSSSSPDPGLEEEEEAKYERRERERGMAALVLGNTNLV
jgi:hypothetical protein